MSKRDKRGRYIRTYREATRFDTFLFVSILGGILFGIVFDVVHKPHVFEVHTAEAAPVAPVAQEVMIEVQYDWTQERIKQEIRSTFPEEPERAVQVSKCESGWRIKIEGPTSDFGLFQIHAPSWDKVAKRLGYDDYQTDIFDNLAMARYIYDNAGQTWRDWSASKHCWNK